MTSSEMDSAYTKLTLYASCSAIASRLSCPLHTDSTYSSLCGITPLPQLSHLLTHAHRSIRSINAKHDRHRHPLALSLYFCGMLEQKPYLRHCLTTHMVPSFYVMQAIAESPLLGLTLRKPRKKISVLIVGNHSAGKSSWINW